MNEPKVKGAIHLWFSPDGEQYQIPDDVFAATVFKKDGWPDKRVKANAKFWAWLAGANAQVEGGDVPSKPYSEAVMRAAVELKRDVEPVVAQAYANKVWAKQSDSLSRHERLGRVADALKAQGLSMDGVVL